MPEFLSHARLQSIAGEFGTPVYVYHAETIHQQFEKLKTAFVHQDVRFFYACKALTNINILRYIRSIGMSVDCSSINEVKLAFYAGFQAQDILYTANSIAFEEIEEAKNLGVHINIDSLSNLKKFGQKFGGSYPVGLRLRPNIMAGGNLKISTGHDKSKFGIPIDQLQELLTTVEEHDLKILGLHIHTGSEIVDADIFLQGIEKLFAIIPHFPNLKFIDLGGGFKVPYKEGDEETDIMLLAQKVKSAFDEHQSTQNKSLQIWFEPGKFIVSSAGYLITKVNVLKEHAAGIFAGLDTGFNHLIRPMFYNAYHHIENISNAGGHKKTYTVVGNICETDTFASDREIAEISEGDLLVFYNAGAYGFEMSSNFNSRFRPAEVLLKDGNATLIRRRETFEDLLQNQVL
jgi:diaminopimelate decarboxylase